MIQDSSPHAVATGDINKDSFLDFAVANYGADNIEIFFGNTNGIFEKPMTISTGTDSHPTSIALADFNHDNILDIMVTNFDSDNLGIFLGNSTGGFIQQLSITLDASNPWALMVNDLNKDNHMDIVVVNHGTENMVILFGIGNGQFTNATIYATGYDSHPYSIAIADLNNDTNLDIAIANYGTNEVIIFYGYGNGTFKQPVRFSTGQGSNPSGIIIIDLNKDNLLDIALSNFGSNNVAILFGYGNGKFAKPRTFSTGSNSHPSHITSGYFNRDNLLDMAITHYGTNSIGIFLGNESKIFEPQTAYSTGSGSHPTYIVTSNLDGNNQSKLIVANTGVHNILSLSSYVNNVSLLLTKYSTGSSSRPHSAQIGDFNNDKLLDIYVVTTDNSLVFLGYGNGSFADPIIDSNGGNMSPCSLTVADFNNDNQSDIARGCGGLTNLTILLGYGNGTFFNQGQFSVGEDLIAVAITYGDFNGDKLLDIAATDHSITGFSILLGDGNGSFIGGGRYSLGNGADESSIATGDFNRDNRLDIAISTRLNGIIYIFLGYGNGSFYWFTSCSTGAGSNPVSIVVADINNDHLLDISVAVYAAAQINLFFGYGNGSFTKADVYSSGFDSHPTSINVADLNNDGRLDIVTLINVGIAIFFAYDHGKFSNQITYPIAVQSGLNSLSIGDFNGDYRLDFNVAIKDSFAIGILISNFSAGFNIQNQYSTGSHLHPSSIVVRDINKDRKLDIIVVYALDENFGIRLGDGNGTFATDIVYSTGTGSRPQYIVIDYFDNDATLDISTIDSVNNRFDIFLGDKNGNFGKRTTYSTSDLSQPSSMAVSNFNTDDWVDIVVANEGTNDISVYLGFHYPTFADSQNYVTGTNAIPSSLASADFNEDHYLDLVVANNMNDNIRIFFGSGNGSFGNQSTYSTGASSSPTFVVVVDLNNDAHLDIAVTVKGYIVIFLGYGNGSFSNMISYSTTEDSVPVSVAIGDVNSDNQLDIVVANTQASNILIFLGYGNGSFSMHTEYSIVFDAVPQSLAIFDLNRDNKSDLIMLTVNYISILLGYGNGTFKNTTTYPIDDGSTPQMITLGDFNNDSRPDIAATFSSPSILSIYFGNADGTFKDPVKYQISESNQPSWIAISDLNGDQRLDIAVTDTRPNSIVIFFGSTNGIFSTPKLVQFGSIATPNAVVFSDFNNDGMPDIAVIDSSHSTALVLLANGIMLFDKKTSYSMGNGSKPCSVTVADLNNDSRKDIIVANNGASTVGILLGSANATFRSLMTYSTGTNSHPCAVAVYDFNNDNRLDIAVVNSNTNNIGILIGNGDGTFSNVITYSVGDGALPYSLAVDDFNDDHQLDIAVANYGTSNVFILLGNGNGSFTPDSPIEIGYGAWPNSIGVGNFNQDNWTDIAVSTYGTGNIEIILKTC